MEPVTTPPTHTSQPLSHGKGSSIGAIIGLCLILAIIVAGAYIALNDRLATQPVVQGE